MTLLHHQLIVAALFVSGKIDTKAASIFWRLESVFKMTAGIEVVPQSGTHRPEQAYIVAPVLDNSHALQHRPGVVKSRDGDGAPTNCFTTS